MNATDKTSFETIPQIGKDVTKDTRAEVHGAIDKAAERAHPAVDRLANRAHDGVDKVGDGFEVAAAKYNSASATLAERSKQAVESYKQYAETGREYVRSRPAVSLLVAAAAGYGLSKLLGGRK